MKPVTVFPETGGQAIRLKSALTAVAFAVIIGLQDLRYGDTGRFVFRVVFISVALWLLEPVIERAMKRHLCAKCPFKDGRSPDGA